MNRGWVLWMCLPAGCMLEPTLGGGSTGESDGTLGSSSASPSTAEPSPSGTTPGQTSASAGPGESDTDDSTTSYEPTDDSTTSQVPADGSTTSQVPGDDSTTSHVPGDGSTTSHVPGNDSTSSSENGTSSTIDDSSSSDASTSSSGSGKSTGDSSSGESSSSSSTGDEVDPCYTAVWSIKADDTVRVAQVAAVADGLVYATGPALDLVSAWVGAWDQDGVPQWSRTVDAEEFGLADDDGMWNQPAAVDIDVLADGDALLSFQDRFIPTSAVFVRLDATTGDTVWASVFGQSELAPFELIFPVNGSTPYGAAVTGSGRVFVVGAAHTDVDTIIYAAELDHGTGADLWLAAVDGIDALTIQGYVGRGVAAHDDAGLFYGDAWSALGPGWGGNVHRVSLDGDALGDLGPEELGTFESLAIDDTGELALAWVAISSFDQWATYTPYLERRSGDFTWLAGGLDSSPELTGTLAFEADGDIVIADADLSQLDADLNVVSVDDFEGDRWSIATQSDGSLVLGGAEPGGPVVEKYDGCGL